MFVLRHMLWWHVYIVATLHAVWSKHTKGVTFGDEHTVISELNTTTALQPETTYTQRVISTSPNLRGGTSNNPSLLHILHNLLTHTHIHVHVGACNTSSSHRHTGYQYVQAQYSHTHACKYSIYHITRYTYRLFNILTLSCTQVFIIYHYTIQVQA